MPKRINRYLPEYTYPVDVPEAKPHKYKIYMLDTAKIVPNKAQPRKAFDTQSIAALADSIKQFGILQPLTVRKIKKSPKYELIAGERRLRAAMSIGMKTVPCIIIPVDDERSATLAVIENIQRQDLNMFDMAGAIFNLSEKYAMTQSKLAKVLSVSQPYIANKLRLLRLGSDERRLILNAGLTERHARALLTLFDRDLRLHALKHIIEHKLNVSESEKYINTLQSEEMPEKEKTKPKIAVKDIRVFINTINHAIDLIKQSGVEVTKEQTDEEDKTVICVKIAKGQRDNGAE